MAPARLGKDVQSATEHPTELPRGRSIEEEGILDMIRNTEDHLKELRKRLALEERITELKLAADALRYQGF